MLVGSTGKGEADSKPSGDINSRVSWSSTFANHLRLRI